MWASYLTVNDATNMPSSVSGASLNEWDLLCNNFDDGQNGRSGMVFVLAESIPVQGGSGFPGEWGQGIGFVNTTYGTVWKDFINMAGIYSVAGIDYRSSHRASATVTATAPAGSTTISIDNVIGFASGTWPGGHISPSVTALIQIGTRLYTQTGIGSLTAGSLAGTITIASPGIVGSDGAHGNRVVSNAQSLFFRTYDPGNPQDGDTIAFGFAGDRVIRYNGGDDSLEFVYRVTGQPPFANFAFQFSNGTFTANTMNLVGNATIAGSMSAGVDFTAGRNITAVNSLTVGGGGLFLNGPNGAGGATGTLINAPVAGPPGYWIPVSIGGNVYHIPCWGP